MTFAPNSTILYVDDARASAAFYTRILGRGPDFQAKGFAAFVVSPGYTIGLQERGQMPSPVGSAIGGSEICLMNVNREKVDEMYNAWVANGIEVPSEPAKLPFGYTFVAHDPDGHALRVCATESTEGP